MPENYWTTTVPVERSVAEIRKLLAAFGAERCAFLEDWQHGRLAVQFQYRSFPVEFGVDIRQVAQEKLKVEPWTSRKWTGKAEYEKNIETKAAKVAMRILAHHLKAALIAVEYGLISFEDVFLAKFLTRSGETLGELITPRLQEAISQPGRLLPEKAR